MLLCRKCNKAAGAPSAGISYCAAPAMAACAAFYKESRMKFDDPTKPYRKSRGDGAPDFSWCFPPRQTPTAA
jgi:hypothetical protein